MYLNYEHSIISCGEFKEAARVFVYLLDMYQLNVADQTVFRSFRR